MGLATASNTVIIKSLSDFPAPVGNIIILNNNFIYRISGSVNIGANQIQFAISNTIAGVDKSDDKLIYTGTSAMFLNTNQDLTIKNITIAAVSVGASVFSFTGTTNKLDISENIFGSCKSLGTIGFGNVLLFRNNLFALCTEGLTVIGNSAISDLIIADNYSTDDNVGTITFIKSTSGTYGKIICSRNVFNVETGQFGFNFSGITINDSANFSDNIFSGNGTYITGFSHLTSKWIFAANTGIPNKLREYFIGSNTMSGTALSTPVTAASVAAVLTATGVRFFRLRGGNNQDDGVSFTMQIPSDYYSGGRFDINFTTDTTTLNVKLFMGLSVVPSGDNFGTLDETGLSVVSVGTTAYLRIQASITPITTVFLPGDIIIIKIWRDPDDVQDTAAVTAYLSNIQFVYNAS